MEPGVRSSWHWGEVPNLAARLQGLAASNTVVISDATSRLVQGYFACQDLGAQTLRGVAEPVQVYCVLQESGARGRLDVALTRGLTPLVGREQEVGLLVERWEQVKAGHGQVVLLTGEAGIGKSRLVHMLKEHVADEPYIRWECRNAEYYQNTALFPLVDLFQRIWRFEAQETPEEKFGKLEQALSHYRVPVEESVPLFAPLLSVPIPEHPYPPLNLSPQRQRQKTLETIVAILLELAERHPVLLIIEDLHWTDPSTLELLNLVLDQTPTASVLVLLTCRPTFQPSWSHRSYLTEITVNRLSPPQIKRMTAHVAGDTPLSHEVCVQIADKTDGVPLFVEEITKAILEAGHLKEVDGHYHLTGALPSMAIPATLQDALMARLDRLVTAKAVAQYAAVIGRQCAYDVLSTVSQLDAATLQRELGRLVEAEMVYQRGVPPQATFKGGGVLYVSMSFLWWQAVAGIIGVKSSNALRSNSRCTWRHREDSRNVHNTAIRRALSPWRPCGSVTADVHGCPRGVAPIRHPIAIRDNPVAHTGGETTPIASQCHVMRCPPVSPLFASWPWLPHTGCSLEALDMTVH